MNNKYSEELKDIEDDATASNTEYPKSCEGCSNEHLDSCPWSPWCEANEYMFYIRG